MTFPYIQSYTDLGPAKGPRLGVAWHMAEGGGSVEYLSKPNPNSVSVHYVIRGTGQIVQMLPLTHMHSSLRASAIRHDDDAPYTWAGVPVTYGRTAAKAVLGAWADIETTLGPNHATIGVEIEGYAKDGPNTLQRAAMRVLFDYLAGRFPGIRSVGHRDFQDYKPCPGHDIPWDFVGGHGPASEDDDMALKPITTTVPRLIDWPDDTPYYGLDGTTKVGTAAAVTGRYSPFGCGTMRAFYRGDKQLSLVTPSKVYDVAAEADSADTAAAYNEGLNTATAAVSSIPRK